MKKKFGFIIIIIIGLLLVSGCGKSDLQDKCCKECQDAALKNPSAVYCKELPLSAECLEHVQKTNVKITACVGGTGGDSADADTNTKKTGGTGRGTATLSCDSPTDLYYEMTVQSSGLTINYKMWQKGNKMRMEMQQAMVASLYISDGTKWYVYTKLPTGGGKYLEITGNTTAPSIKSPAESTAEIKDYLDSAKSLGTKTINGEKATGYSFSGVGGISTESWFSLDKCVPVQLKTDMSGQITTINYENYDFGSISDSKFEPLPASMIMKIPALGR